MREAKEYLAARAACRSALVSAAMPSGWLARYGGALRAASSGAARVLAAAQLAGRPGRRRSTSALLGVAVLLAAPLGIVGGLLLYLGDGRVLRARGSTWWRRCCRTGRVRFADVPAGFTAYLGDLLTVGFLVWGLQLVASLVLAPFPFLLHRLPARRRSSS